MKHVILAETSQKIRNMGLMCAMLVVSIHVAWPHDEPLSAGWFVFHGLKGGYAGIAVPFFFMASGFFLSMHFDENGWWAREAGKRVKSLVVPYVIWSVIALAAALCLYMVSDHVDHLPFGTSIRPLLDNLWLKLFGFDFTDVPFLAPLWYVRCLIVFVFLSKLFKYVVGRFGWLWLMSAFAFYMASGYIPDETCRDVFRGGFSSLGIFFFSAGVYIGMHGIPRLPRAAFFLSGVAGVALLAVRLLSVYKGWHCESALSCLYLPLLVYFTWRVMPSTRLPAWLTSCAFPIFLMHSPALGYVGGFIRYVVSDELGRRFAAWVLTIVVSIVVTVLLRRFAPRLSIVLFGGR